MKKVKYLRQIPACSIIVCFLLISNQLSIGQSLDDYSTGKDAYYGNGHWGFSLSGSNLSNSKAPNPSSHQVSGLTMKIDFRRYHLDHGGKRLFFQNKTIGDMLFILGKEIRKGTGAERAENSTLGTGLIGWTSWGWNVMSKPKSAFAVGFNLNDYIVGSTYIYTDGNGQPLSPVTLEPQGYYWAGGPSFFFDYQISDDLSLQSFVSYSLAFWRPVSLDYATVDNAYAKPHFGQLNVELHTRFHLYGGLDYVTLVNRGDLPNSTKRFDILIGYQF